MYLAKVYVNFRLQLYTVGMHDVSVSIYWQILAKNANIGPMSSLTAMYKTEVKATQNKTRKILSAQQLNKFKSSSHLKV